MARINIYSDDPYAPQTLIGWFNPDAATRYEQGMEWNGESMVGVITGSEWVDEYLYHTKGGRWILNNDAHRYHNGPDTYRFITDEQARNWLITSQVNDAAIAEHFGELEDERGPGRPEVGPAFSLRFPADLLAKVDQTAKTNNVSRAEQIRRLVAAGL